MGHTPTPQAIMKSIILAAVFAVALAETVVDERVDNGDGTLNHQFQTTNEISVSNVGSIGSAGQSNIQGSYRFPAPEGGFVEVTFVADEGGFQPSGAVLPTAPPMPEHVFELLAIAEQQRASGIQFDQRGFRLN